MEKRRRYRSSRLDESDTTKKSSRDSESAHFRQNDSQNLDLNQSERRRRYKKDICDIKEPNESMCTSMEQVLVIYPEGRFEYVPISAQYMNNSGRYLVRSGDQTFHTHFDCYLRHNRGNNEFRGWFALRRNEVEDRGYTKCLLCEEIDKQLRKEYLTLSYRERVDREWGYYNCEKPLTSFSVTIHNEIYIEEMHRMGEEISVENNSNGKPMLYFGLTEYCPVPKRIIEFCNNYFDDYKMFILDGKEDDSFNLKLCIGVYRRKLWYYHNG